MKISVLNFEEKQQPSNQCSLWVFKDEVIHVRDVKDFGFKFWLLCIICVAYYVAVFPFIGLGL